MALTPRQVSRIDEETKRLGGSFSDHARRLIDAGIDAMDQKNTKIMVLDRETQRLRGIS